MKKAISGALLGLLLALSLNVYTASAANKPSNLYFLKSSEPFKGAAGGRNKIELYTSENCAACGIARAQLERMAPRHPDLIFVIRNLSVSTPLVWVSTSDLDNLVGTRQWTNISDQEADAFLARRAVFAKQEHAVELRIAAVQKQIDTALLPGAEEIRNLKAQITGYESQFAAARQNLLPESMRKRLKELLVEMTDEKPGARTEYMKLATAAKQLEDAADTLLDASTRPLHEKIEQIQQQYAGELIKQREAEKDAFQLIGLRDRIDAKSN